MPITMADGRCPRHAIWLVSRGEVVGLSTRLLLMWRTYEGRRDIRSWKSDVAVGTAMTASYLMWKAFRGSGNGVEGDFLNWWNTWAQQP